MTLQIDEDEHSIEMHLPYVRKVFEGYAAVSRARVRIDTKFDLILQTGHQDCTHTRRGNQLRQRGILRQTPRTVPRCQRHYLCYLK